MIENQNFFLTLKFSIFFLLLTVGIRIIPWMLIGEVFPVNVRSASSGLSSGVGYIFAFFSNKLFLTMITNLTYPGTFLFYSIVAIVACILFYFALPETEGRTLIDIEEHFLGKRSLSEKEKEANAKGNQRSGNRTNGIDLITVAVVPQTAPKTPTNGHTNLSFIGSNTLTVNGNQSVHRLSIPELIVPDQRQPNAGSKRYKHRVSDTMRSHSSISSSNEDVQDTHL